MGIREERKQAFIDDYNFLVDEGLSPGQIIERLGITSDLFYTRLRRYGCKRYTRNQQRIRDLLDVWIKNRERFTCFDFPEYIDGNEAATVISDALKAGEIVKLGKKNHRHGSTMNKMIVYGVPDAPVRVPTIEVLRDAGLDGFGYERRRWSDAEQEYWNEFRVKDAVS